jgi:Bacterial lectin
MVTLLVSTIISLLFAGCFTIDVSAQESTFLSDDFASDSGAWQYLGSAYRDQANQQLVLTTSSNDQTGVAWFKAPIRGSFIANFSYKAVGDGFLLFFYKQKYPSGIAWEESYGANGVAGGRLGFNTQAIIPGYGIEFDGWANIAYEFADIIGGKPNPSADPSNNHIALIKDFTGNHIAYMNDPTIHDNVWHQASIEVQGSSITVYLDQKLTLQWSGTLDRTYDGFGFSGSNGQCEASWHIIDNFSLVARDLKKSLLTLSCESSSSFCGFNVEVHGGLTFDGNAIANAPILLSYSVTGGKSWQDLTLLYTEADGRYSATWLPSVTGNYLLRASYEGNAETLGTSEIVNFAVMQLVRDNLFSVSSNSSVTSLEFNSTTSVISFTVSGPSGTTGYVKAAVAKGLISNPENMKVFLDSRQLSYTVESIDGSWLLSFVYEHSVHQVIINLAASGGPAMLGVQTWIVVAGVIFAVGLVPLIYFVKLRIRQRGNGVKNS